MRLPVSLAALFALCLTANVAMAERSGVSRPAISRPERVPMPAKVEKPNRVQNQLERTRTRGEVLDRSDKSPRASSNPQASRANTSRIVTTTGQKVVKANPIVEQISQKSCRPGDSGCGASGSPMGPTANKSEKTDKSKPLSASERTRREVIMKAMKKAMCEKAQCESL